MSPVALLVTLFISAFCAARYLKIAFKTSLVMILCCNCSSHEGCKKCSCCGDDDEIINTEEEEANNDTENN